MAGTLYVVATPIGNLHDASDRLKDTLYKVDTILAENPPVVSKLLKSFEITTPVERFHEHSNDKIIKKQCGFLKEGKSIALVSDAGTPGISDPGNKLVDAVYTNVPRANVVPIPGPSAITSLLSVTGLKTTPFVFLGFPPTKKGRNKFFEQVNNYEMMVVLYESPHRITKTLAALQNVLPQTAFIIIGRELTKLHEEVLRGTPAAILEYFETHDDKVRGEFVIAIKQ